MLSLSLLVCALVVPSLAFPFVSPAETHPFGLFKRASSGCSTSGPASCSSSQAGSCCFEAPGGLLVQPQFWDFSPSTGPSNSWTIHGLWPDKCDGTFQESCDPSRNYGNIANLLTAQGASDTLNFMQTFWVDINGKDETFWEHEWSTHGTCLSTFEPSCLQGSNNPTGAEAVAYFQSAVKLFQTLPTYQWLADAGITPDDSKTYSLSEITSALQSASGVLPALDCKSGSLNQIYWYFNLQGSGIDGTFVPIDAPKAGTCPSSGLSYPKKSGSSVPVTTTSHTTKTSTKTTSTTSKTTTTTTSTTSGSPGSTPTGIPAKGHITGLVSGSSTGGLLSAGTWSDQTLATYTFSGSASSFTLQTSKGPCAVESGAFICGSGVSASSFSAVSSGSQVLLAYQGSTSWSSDGSPSGTAQEKVFSGSSHSVAITLAIA